MKLVNRAYGILIIVILLSSNLISQQNIIVQDPEILSTQDASFQNFAGTYPNRLTIQLQMLWSIDHWENYMKWVTDYPAGKLSANILNTLITRTNHVWTNNNWESSSWVTWEYDDDGVLVKYVSYDNLGIPHQQILYNAPYTNGQYASSLSQVDYGSGWENHEQTSRTYDTNGNLNELIVENWDRATNVWVIRFRSVYTYVQPGCLDTRTSFSDDNGSWITTFRSTYVYDNCISEMVPYQPWPLWNCNPTQVIDESTSDNGVTWIPSATYIYSDFGSDCLPRTYNYANGFQERANFEYEVISGGKVSSVYDNSNLRCTKKTIQNFTDNVWVNSTKTWYSYEGLMLDTESESVIPEEFTLEQNYPNPFNPNTTINFTLSSESNVKLSVYDMTGKLIKELISTSMQIGNHNIEWDGTDDSGGKVGAGVYLYQLQTNNFSESRKMILMK
jgi:hypothetical protein